MIIGVRDKSSAILHIVVEDTPATSLPGLPPSLPPSLLTSLPPSRMENSEVKNQTGETTCELPLCEIKIFLATRRRSS